MGTALEYVVAPLHDVVGREVLPHQVRTTRNGRCTRPPMSKTVSGSSGSDGPRQIAANRIRSSSVRSMRAQLSCSEYQR